MLDYIRNYYPDIYNLIVLFTSKGIDVFILGDFVRDYLNNEHSDKINLVVDCTQEYLDKSIKLPLNKSINVSIRIQDGVSEDDLLKSMFLNYDAVMCHINKNKTYDSYYESCMESDVLDLVSIPDSVDESLILRCHYLKYLYGFSFGYSLASYITNSGINVLNLVDKVSDKDLKKYLKNGVNFV